MSFIKKIKKKNLILVGLFAILLVLSYVNYTYFNPTKTVSEDNNEDPYNAHLVNGDLSEEEIMAGNGKISSEFFADYRLERERTRSENIETLQTISENKDTSAESISNAQNEMVSLVKLSEQELLVENLIKSKGFSDCVVFIHQGYVNVVVEAEAITPQQAVQIQDIIAKECSVELSKITVAVSGK